FKVLVQVVLALTMIEFTPVDVGELEQRAGLSSNSVNMVDMEQLVQWAANPQASLISAAYKTPQKVDQDSLGIVTTAVSAVVIDQESGAILFEKNIDEIRSIGSITKLMTAYVAMQSGLDLDAFASVSEQDLRQGGHLYLYLDDQVTVREVLQASLVGSDNSATIALARLSGLSPEQFVQKMNMTAFEIGLTKTTFADPTGLSVQNRSTAREIAKLLDLVLANEEIKQATTQTTSYFTSLSGHNYTIPNTNELLNSFINDYPYQIVGGKTGYLPEAGYCLAIQAEEDQGRDIFVVVLGSDTKDDRFREVKGLTQWAYDTYDWPDQL
ncbi:MAG: serine hydrolase, partial [Candidatus Uhrbacteria bacterium]